MKKAFLVTANITTRVVIEIENDKLNGEEYDMLVANAKEQLINNLTDDYLNCIEDVREDKECPYDTDEEINQFGIYCDIDVCSEMNKQGFCPFHWADYKDDDEDHNNFFNDFNKWWEKLPFERQKEIYNILTKNN